MRKKRISKVGIIAKPKIPDLVNVISDLSDWLRTKDVEYLIDSEVLALIGNGDSGVHREDLPGEVDLLIVLGGDGTILSVGTSAAKAGVPLIGINMGNLGFMAETTREEMYQTLEQVINGDYQISRRMLLHGELIRGAKVIREFEALNDFVIDNTQLARMIEAEVFLDDDFVIRFRADGLIVASPTGSTAYSLSAGGPILYPLLDAFVVTPICPHTLTYRPLVVGSESKIELVTYALGGESRLTIDGQRGEDLLPQDKIRITKSENYLNLIQSATKDYFQILNEKLHWGGKRRIK